MYSTMFGKASNARTYWKSEGDRLYRLGPRVRASIAKRNRTSADRVKRPTEAQWGTP